MWHIDHRLFALRHLHVPLSQLTLPSIPVQQFFSCLPRKKLELKEVTAFFEKGEKNGGTRFQNQVCLTQWPRVDSFSTKPCCLTRKLWASSPDVFVGLCSSLWVRRVMLKWLQDKRTSCGGFIKNKYPQLVLLPSSLNYNQHWFFLIPW